MSFDVAALTDAIDRHGPVARVVVADVAGSVPREPGAAMLVWATGQSGTIGGGALEFQAAQNARAALTDRNDRFDRVPLGPRAGQCCGGRVSLLTEVWTKDRLGTVGDNIVARPCPDHARGPSLGVQRILSRARGTGADVVPALVDGWMIEPLSTALRHVWIYGAGHVGRALVSVLAPLPRVAVTWVDTHADRLPKNVPEHVSVLTAVNPADLVAYAPQNAEHLVLTYSHALDLEICHRILSGSFRSAGLIGSRTKWARFRKRLAALGHSTEQISRIQCPIGDPALGKHPQAIAIGVARAFLEADLDGASMKTDAG